MNNTMADAKIRLKRVEKDLIKQPWFKKQKWLLSIHPFPNEKSPEAVTIHVYKKHWWNNDHGGIHVESFLDLRHGKLKKSAITVHLLHVPKIPGTTLKREKLSKPVVDELFSQVLISKL